MYIIVGLGNPEKKYLNTWHNAGFMCLDKVAAKLGVSFDKAECRSMTAHTRVGGEKVILAKPLTYMNLSGEACVELTRMYKPLKSHFLVVYDDVDLPLGNVRIRKEGSAGTHNGMRNIVQNLSATDFPRARIGTKKETPMALVDFVLSQITDEDKVLLDPALESTAEAIVEFVSGTDIDIVMQKHNTKK